MPEAQPDLYPRLYLPGSRLVDVPGTVAASAGGRWQPWQQPNLLRMARAVTPVDYARGVSLKAGSRLASPPLRECPVQGPARCRDRSLPWPDMRNGSSVSLL